MKKALLFVIPIFLSFNTVVAQDITNKLGGDTDAVKYNVTDSGGKELFRVQGDGNVGIGTTTPSEALDVDGNIKVSGTVDGIDIATAVTANTAKVTDDDDGVAGAYGPGWDSDGEAPTKDAVYDKIEKLPGGHDAVTIGTPNGLLLSGQQISLSAATTGAAGAMSSADKTKLNKIASENTSAIGINSTAMGSYSNAIGNNSTAIGLYAKAVGEYSTAMGYNTEAGGIGSIVMNRGTTASGEYSTAMGYFTTASGNQSTAMGEHTTASGNRSTAMGRYTQATFANSTVVGMYNEVDGDALFIVGDGTNGGNRRNAFEVDNDGDAWVRDNFYVGTDDGSDNDYIYFDNSTDEYLRWKDTDGDNHFEFSDDLKAKDLWCGFGTTTYRKFDRYVFGDVISNAVMNRTSDQNLKQNIQTVTSPLEKLQLLRGVTYDWNQVAKDYFTQNIRESISPDESLTETEKEAVWDEERQKILVGADKHTMSFIAQEVEEVFPEWVKENEEGYKEIDMKGLNSLLVEAVKELKVEKDSEIQELKELNQILIARIEKLENK